MSTNDRLIYKEAYRLARGGVRKVVAGKLLDSPIVERAYQSYHNRNQPVIVTRNFAYSPLFGKRGQCKGSAGTAHRVWVPQASDLTLRLPSSTWKMRSYYAKDIPKQEG